MENPINELSVQKIQLDAVKTIALGFEKKDFHKGQNHRETLQAVSSSIVNSTDRQVKIAGLEILGDYASKDYAGQGVHLRFPAVRAATVETIATISCDDEDNAVKLVGLDQVSRRLDIYKGTDGEDHDQAVEAIRKIASSVVAKDGRQAELSVINKAMEVLGAYAARKYGSTKDDLFSHVVQQKALDAINFLTTTMGVEKLTDLQTT